MNVIPYSFSWWKSVHHFLPPLQFVLYHISPLQSLQSWDFICHWYVRANSNIQKWLQKNISHIRGGISFTFSWYTYYMMVEVQQRLFYTGRQDLSARSSISEHLHLHCGQPLYSLLPLAHQISWERKILAMFIKNRKSLCLAITSFTSSNDIREFATSLNINRHGLVDKS